MQGRHGKLPAIKLHPSGNHRCLGGHPWIFANEFEPPQEIVPGSEVDVTDAHGRFIGRGYYNPKSKIAVRIFTHSSHATLDTAFFAERISAARRLRARRLPPDEPHRVLFSEADRVPGAIVDLYGSVAVVQVLTLGIEEHRMQLFEAVASTLKPTSIYERSDASSRSKEGLAARCGSVLGDTPERITVETDGIRFEVSPARGHKTGCYLDQRLNRRRFGALAEGARVLDAFAYNGFFGLYAAAAGAAEVTAIESSKEACADIAANAAANGASIEILEENAFEALRRLDAEGRRFDLISLDPPSFTRSGPAAGGALRGYKEINLRALKLLADGGRLFTSSCSYHTGREEFLEMLAGAVHDSQRDVQFLDIHGASPDHPVRLEIPETDYLKCVELQAWS